MPAVANAADTMTVRLPVTIKVWPIGYGTKEMGITQKWYFSAFVMRIEVVENSGRGFATKAEAEKAARKAIREWEARQNA